jgi:hypothetical protein
MKKRFLEDLNEDCDIEIKQKSFDEQGDFSMVGTETTRKDINSLRIWITKECDCWSLV